MLVFVVSCTKRYQDVRYNPHDFPIKDLSVLFDMEDSDFIEVREAERYITLKEYEFFVIDYKAEVSSVPFTTAVTKNKNLFFILNYPERFGFKNFNNLMKSDQCEIPDKASAMLFIKFLSKLFIPDTYLVEEVEDAMKEGKLPDVPLLFVKLRKYKTEIDIITRQGKHFIADFHTIGRDNIMYEWRIKFTPRGKVTNCKVTMMSLDEEYKVTGRAVIFDRAINNMKSKGTASDPSFYSP
jgi:hypothetical protein